MNIDKILGLLSSLDTQDTETLDIKTDEGYEKFIDLLDEFEDNPFQRLVFESVFGEDSIESLKELADTVHKNAKKEAKKETKKEVKKVEEKKEEEIVRPSTKLTTEQGLQIHKLVQEYVDTMIKPYAKGLMSNEQINDAYAGLYEFAAWILNK